MTSGQLVDGLVGKAISFDGSNDYIEVADSASLDITEAITIETLCYTTANKNQGLLNKQLLNESQTTNAYAQSINTLTFSSGSYINSTPTYATVTTGIDKNKWLFVAGTYNKQYIQNSVDGSFSNTVSHTSSIITNNYPLYIGKYNKSDGTYALQGKIEHIRISNVKRSDAWIKATNYSLRDEIITFNN